MQRTAGIVSFSLLILVTAAWPGSDRAQSAQLKKDIELCLNATLSPHGKGRQLLAANPDLLIESCTHAIDGGVQNISLVLPLALATRAKAYLQKEDYSHAISDLDRLIRLEPKNVEALYDRGWAHLDNEQYELAIQDFDQGLKLKPESAALLYSRATAYDDKGEYDLAIQDYDQAVRIKPDFSNAFHNRANSYRHRGDYDQAIQDYDRAIKIRPDYALAFHNRGITEFLQGQFVAAASDFSRNVDLEPQQSYLLIWLYVAQARGDQKADETLRRAKALDASSWPAPIVALYNGMLEPTALFEAADSSDPWKQKKQTCEAHFFLGEYDLIHGRQEEAATELQLAADICRVEHECSFIAKAESRRLADAKSASPKPNP